MDSDALTQRFRYFLLLPLLSILITACQPKEITSAKIYILSNDWDRAIEMLEQAVEAHPNNAEAHFLLGKAYGDRLRYKEMRREFQTSLQISAKFQQKILAETENHWINNYSAGIRAQSNVDFKRAEKLFKTAITINPGKREAYKKLAVNYIDTNQPDQAVKIYSKLLEESPNDIELLMAVGSLYYSQRKFDKVVPVLKRVLEIEPDHHDALTNLALSYDSMGRVDKALIAFQKAVEANPLDKDLIFLLGVHYYKRSNFVKAIEIFERVLELSPGDFESTSNIGNAYLSIAEELRAKLKSRANGSHTPAEIQEIKTKAILNYKKVIPYLEKALDMQPNHPVLWQNLGVAYINTGENEKGKEAFLKAEELKLQSVSDSPDGS